MIRSVGRTGPLKVAGRVCWALRFDVAALLVAAAVLVPIPDAIQEENAVAVLSVLGISATIFIGFRNTTAAGPTRGTRDGHRLDVAGATPRPARRPGRSRLPDPVAAFGGGTW